MELAKLVFEKLIHIFFTIRILFDRFTRYKKPLAVVIIHHLPRFSNDQEQNIDSCFLRAPVNADYFILLPRGVEGTYYLLRYPSAKIYYLSGWLDSYSGFNLLKASAYFYLLFRSYEWILTFEPDAYLYRSNLESYYLRNVDYWGAPWIRDEVGKIQWVGVGNGGFSLRRTIVFLLYFRARKTLKSLLTLTAKRECFFLNLITTLHCLAGGISYEALPPKSVGNISLEDGFWSSEAYDTHYRDLLSSGIWVLTLIPFLAWRIRKPHPQQAVHFSIETYPRWALGQAHIQLPTGSHALNKYDHELHLELLKKIEQKVLRVAYQASARWERGYIQSLLDIGHAIEIDEWTDPAEIVQRGQVYPVLVLGAPPLNWQEAIDVVLKLKPRIVILCSDESGDARNWFYRPPFLFLKQYSHGQFKKKSSHAVQIPLGYMTGYSPTPPWKAEVPGVERRLLPWAFVGAIKQDRKIMVDAFQAAMPNGSAVVDGSYMPHQVFETYRNAVFVPNGRGNTNLDCFRLYEAAFAGAIPVVVAKSREFVDTFSYNGDVPPFLVYSNWKEAARECAVLLRDSKRLETLQHANLSWIRRKIIKIQQLISEKISDVVKQ